MYLHKWKHLPYQLQLTVLGGHNDSSNKQCCQCQNSLLSTQDKMYIRYLVHGGGRKIFLLFYPLFVFSNGRVESGICRQADPEGNSEKRSSSTVRAKTIFIMRTRATAVTDSFWFARFVSASWAAQQEFRAHISQRHAAIQLRHSFADMFNSEPTEQSADLNQNRSIVNKERERTQIFPINNNWINVIRFWD